MSKRSLTIAGHRTSISLEDAFWDGLAEMAARKKQSVAGVIASIDRTRPASRNLSAAVHIAVLEWYRNARS